MILASSALNDVISVADGNGRSYCTWRAQPARWVLLVCRARETCWAIQQNVNNNITKRRQSSSTPSPAWFDTTRTCTWRQKEGKKDTRRRRRTVNKHIVPKGGGRGACFSPAAAGPDNIPSRCTIDEHHLNSSRQKNKQVDLSTWNE